MFRLRHLINANKFSSYLLGQFSEDQERKWRIPMISYSKESFEIGKVARMIFYDGSDT